MLDSNSLYFIFKNIGWVEVEEGKAERIITVLHQMVEVYLVEELQQEALCLEELLRKFLNTFAQYYVCQDLTLSTFLWLTIDTSPLLINRMQPHIPPRTLCKKLLIVWFGKVLLRGRLLFQLPNKSHKRFSVRFGNRCRQLSSSISSISSSSSSRHLLRVVVLIGQTPAGVTVEIVTMLKAVAIMLTIQAPPLV